MDRPTCKTCIFYLVGEDVETVGDCHRFPPSDPEGIWPAVTEREWCGEHPDFPEWLESQRKVDIKRPCRECGREVIAGPLSPDKLRINLVCDRGHNNGWQWIDAILVPPAESHKPC
jgi:hypothetical protein